MTNRIAAIVLAAGLSSRMGQQKMLLPWGKSTVINTVVDQIKAARLSTIVVVTGKDKNEIEKSLSGEPVTIVYNSHYKDDNMAISLQTGLRELPASISAALIFLGDQPQIEPNVIEMIIAYYQRSDAKIIIPQFMGKKGHPWLLDRSLWNQILLSKPPPIMRDFQLQHNHQIKFVNVNSDTILKDLDTFDDYIAQRPEE